MGTFDPSRLALNGRLPERKRVTVGARQTARFVRGPIPWGWICRAAQLPGAALAVSVALWHLAGMKRSETVSLSNGLMAELGVERHAKYRALAALEGAGLIMVKRQSGRSTVGTILSGASEP